MRSGTVASSQWTRVDLPLPEGAEMIKTVVMRGGDFPPQRRRDAEKSAEPLAAGQPAVEAHGKLRRMVPRESAAGEVSGEKTDKDVFSAFVSASLRLCGGRSASVYSKLRLCSLILSISLFAARARSVMVK